MIKDTACKRKLNEFADVVSESKKLASDPNLHSFVNKSATEHYASPKSESYAVDPACNHFNDEVGVSLDSNEKGRSIDILPKNIKPNHYNIVLTPGLPDFKFKGEVDINISVEEVTDVIEMNARDIDVESIDIKSKDGQSVKCTQFSVDNETDRLIIKMDGPLERGSEWILHIKYVGNHNDLMVGFYRVGSCHDGKKEYMYATQHESSFCRRTLPCWDEPNIKCTFDVTLAVPATMLALSNMDVCSEVTDPDSLMKTIKFNTTPKMSTYLLAFVVGRYDFVEKYTTSKKISTDVVTSSVRCRVYARSKNIEYSTYALDFGCKVLEFFEEYFKIPYPLPKMDQVPISNFRHGAMENWGLVTYREVALLLDPKKSGTRAKHLVSIYIGHEFAHQWFGNLVTMKWWNDLWLNEGFATFAGTLVLDNLCPEWTPFLDFILDELHPALSLDSMTSTHPIDVPVYSSVDVPQIFDAISYSKGASVIRMLFSFMGESKFRDGLCHYLKVNSYSNATTNDLWIALKEKSGVDVETIMDAWVSKPGYPVVTITGEVYDEGKNEMTIHLEQKRYYASGGSSVTKHHDETIWCIPLTIITDEICADNPLKFIFNGQKSSLTFKYKKSSSSFYKLNAKFGGLYRVCMLKDSYSNIVRLVSEKKCNLSVEDKINLLSDAFSLAKSGEGSFSMALDTLAAFRSEKNYYIMKIMADMIVTLSTVLHRTPDVVEAMNKFAIDIFEGTLNELGYAKSPDEDELDTLKRKLAISVLSFAKHKGVLRTLRENFDKLISGDENAIDPDLREIAYISVLKHSTRPKEDFDLVVGLYKSEQAPDQKMSALNALGAVNNVSIVKKLLTESVFDGDFVKQQDIIYLIRSIVTETPLSAIVWDLAWKFLKSEWNELVKRFESSPRHLGRIFSLASCMDSGSDVIKSVKDWLNGEDIKNSDDFKTLFDSRQKGLKLIRMEVDHSLESLEIRTEWISKHSHHIKEWLAKSKYMHTS